MPSRYSKRCLRAANPRALIVDEKGLVQVRDESEIESAIDAVLSENPKEVEQFRAGKDKLFGFFVGQIMRKTKGKANPALVNEILRKKARNGVRANAGSWMTARRILKVMTGPMVAADLLGR